MNRRDKARTSAGRVMQRDAQTFGQAQNDRKWDVLKRLYHAGCALVRTSQSSLKRGCRYREMRPLSALLCHPRIRAINSVRFRLSVLTTMLRT
jgi:hypothetical protein